MNTPVSNPSFSYHWSSNHYNLTIEGLKKQAYPGKEQAGALAFLISCKTRKYVPPDTLAVNGYIHSIVRKYHGTWFYRTGSGSAARLPEPVQNRPGPYAVLRVYWLP